MTLNFTFYIKPQAKERPRFSKHGHAYTSIKTKTFENTIKYLAKKQFHGKPLETPLTIVFNFYFKRPKRTILKYPRPDLDNLIKSCSDSLNGIAYKDDSQIIRVYGYKAWGEEDRIDVSIVEAE